MYSNEPKIPWGLVFIGAVLFISLIGFASAFEAVDAGTVRVVTRYGGTTGKILQPGPGWKAPFVDGTVTLPTRKLVYEITSEEKMKDSNADYKDYPVDTNTSDGQQVDVYYTVRFNIDPYKAIDIVNKLGNLDGAVERIVKTESRIWVRNIPREFTAEQLYQGDGVIEVQKRIEEKLRPTFESNGLYLDSVGIREIKFQPQYVAAIEAKQIEAVKVETEKNIAEQAKFRKEASITEAQAQAEAQRLQSQTLTEDVLAKLQLEVQLKQAEALKIAAEKGTPIVPSTVVGENVPMLFTIPQTGK